MNTDTIAIIAIGNSSELRIYPNREQFEFIWRSAAQVQWNSNDNCLFSPKPNEWNYSDWFLHILSVVYSEYKIKLIIDETTKWNNVPGAVKSVLLDVYPKFEIFLAAYPK